MLRIEHKQHQVAATTAWAHSMSSCKGVMILVPPGTGSLHAYTCK
jgi:hypothetical protein